MKLLNIKFVILLILLLCTTISSAEQRDAKKLLDKDVISLIEDGVSSSILYAASDSLVYKTTDSGRTWNRIYNISEINKLYFDYTKNILYVLTQGGLYRSKDVGINWQLIFRGSSDTENNCLSLAISQKVMYLGTEEGLFISYDQGGRWHKLIEQFSEDIISSLIIQPQDDNVVYVASNRGVFITTDSAQTWKRIYIVYGYEIPEEDYSDYDEEYNDKVSTIYDMAISSREPHGLYIACKEGMFLTEDKGNSWKQVTNIGLKSLTIRSVKISEDGNDLFAATRKGVFRLKGDNWQHIDSNVGYGDFYDLVIDKDNRVLVAGINGIYELDITEDSVSISNQKEVSDSRIDSVDDIFKGEPNIEDVQKAAIRYADVDINKILNWRRQSRVKALCPDVSVSYNKTIYGSSTGQMAIGPRDWSLGLSWDVADLIWNSDETSIDSRSRLTVQLRQDVLDQVNRLYYERRRLKAEMFLAPPQDKKEEMIKLLEIDEVTAGLDALTNGYFSSSLQ